MHLLRLTAPPVPAWEPDQGWRVLDPDGHVVDAGPKTVLTAANATLDLLESLGALDGIPLLGTGQERQ